MDLWVGYFAKTTTQGGLIRKAPNIEMVITVVSFRHYPAKNLLVRRRTLKERGPCEPYRPS